SHDHVYHQLEAQRLFIKPVMSRQGLKPNILSVKLLLPFASKQGGCAIDRMTVEALTPAVVRKFLDHLEHDRRCSEATRNQRLATIHSLARYIGMRSPVHLAWCSDVRAIPFKKTAKASIGYLEKAEMDALLGQPDRRTNLGVRDHTPFLFLYNSGARADEAARLTIGSLQLGTSPLTRFGIHRIITQYAAAASKMVPSLATKRVSPHTIRHTTAVHLLRAGVDINTIRAWLGHVSLDTTNIYAEVDLEMKAKALAKVDISGLKEPPK
ncbi:MULTISPECIES: tyrosine-type recombinase/integrase, partial [unclassified Rhizobium]